MGNYLSNPTSQEEDFVTHTFNRSLLENIGQDEILQLLQDTEIQLSGSTEIPPEIKDALLCRLHFREKFLGAVEEVDSRDSVEKIKEHWSGLQTLLPNLKSSATLGKPVLGSFSAKLQRKLASTVPPRPIVELCWEATCDHLERLCRDGSVAAEVLNYYDSHSLMVSPIYLTCH